MPLLGRHSQNPNGNPELLAQFGSLTPEQLATIARGGAVNLGNGTVNFSDGKPERAAELAAARALIAGNTQAFGQIADQAGATHRDWTGGTLAGLAPAAAGLIPGVGIPLGAALGAGVGAASRAGGLTNGSVLGGAAQGAALGGAASAARQAAGSVLNRAKTYGDAAIGVDANGRNVDTGELVNRAAGAAGSGSGILDQARRFLSGGAGGVGGALQTGMGVLGAVQGAQRQGQANDIRTQALAALQPGQGLPSAKGVYDDPGNPYARPAVNTALQSARASLRGY